MEIENKSKLKISKKNDVLIYMGDRQFFSKKIGGSLFVPDETVDKAISNCVTGIIIEKGSKAFEDHDFMYNIGDRISFKGYHGQTYSALEEGQPKDKRGYYKIIKDDHIEALCVQAENIDYSSI